MHWNGNGLLLLGEGQVDKETWSEMMLWKCGLKWLEIGVFIGVISLVERCEGVGCKLCMGMYQTSIISAVMWV